jgi:hypothetical protein
LCAVSHICSIARFRIAGDLERPPFLWTKEADDVAVQHGLRRQMERRAIELEGERLIRWANARFTRP